jgi:hypothetical protein
VHSHDLRRSAAAGCGLCVLRYAEVVLIAEADIKQRSVVVSPCLSGMADSDGGGIGCGYGDGRLVSPTIDPAPVSI